MDLVADAEPRAKLGFTVLSNTVGASLTRERQLAMLDGNRCRSCPSGLSIR